MPPHKLSTPIGHLIKTETVAIVGEFVGTFLFLFFAFMGTQIANTSSIATAAGAKLAPQLQPLLFISLVFGFSLAVNAWIFFRISGGLFNPVVTLSMVLIGAVDPIRYDPTRGPAKLLKLSMSANSPALVQGSRSAYSTAPGGNCSCRRG